MLKRLAGQFMNVDPRQFAGEVATTNRHLSFLHSPAIRDSTAKGSFDLVRALTQRKSTIYLVIPLEHAERQSALLRLWLTACFHAVMAGGLQEHWLTQFVLDETSMLKQFDPVNSALDRIAGFGARLHFFFQNVEAARMVFPEGQVQKLHANTTRIFFGVGDYETGEMVSKSIGSETLIVAGGSSNRGGSSTTSSGHGRSESSSRSWGTNHSWSQQKRELMQPDELMRLPRDQAITLIPGMPPVRTRLLKYDQEPWLMRKNGEGEVVQLGRTFIKAAALLVTLAVLCAVLAMPTGYAMVRLDAWLKAPPAQMQPMRPELYPPMQQVPGMVPQPPVMPSYPPGRGVPGQPPRRQPAPPIVFTPGRPR